MSQKNLNELFGQPNEYGGAHISLRIFSFPLSVVPEVGLPDHGSSVFNSLRHHHTIFHSDYTSL